MLVFEVSKKRSAAWTRKSNSATARAAGHTDARERGTS